MAARSQESSPRDELQAALVLLARGQQAQREAEITADATKLLDAARKDLRAAIGQLDALHGKLQAAIKTHGDDREGANLAALNRTARLHSARAYQTLALCYPEKTADRADALNLAIAKLRPLSGLPETDPLHWQARLTEAQCRRLAKNFDAAARIIESLQKQTLSAEATTAVQLENAQLAMASGRVSEALKILDADVKAADKSLAPHWNQARLEVYLAVWRAAEIKKDERQTAIWREKTTQLMERIESRDGTYWTALANARLAGGVGASLANHGVKLLVAMAEGHLQAGRLEPSLAAYDAAAEKAQDQGDAARAFELRWIAGTVAQQRGRLDTAMDRYRQAALQSPEHKHAAEVHWQATWNASVLHGSGSKYEEILLEHLKHWPKEETAGEATFWLGRLRQSQKRWADAIAAFAAVPESHTRHSAAVTAASQCRASLLAESKNAAAKPTLESIAALAKANPQDGDLQERYAEALLAGEDKSSRQTALVQWRLVESKSRPATPRWFRARYGVARAYERLGDKKSAAKLVARLAESHPDLGGPEMKLKFQSLAERCRM